jgi:hypothetical protein
MMPIVCANIWLGSALIGMQLPANRGKAMALNLDDELR